MKAQNDYHLMTKDERLSIYLQAVSRGDTQTTQEVIQASPRVDVKMIDFSTDLHALMFATILHCLGQANLFTAITNLWEERDNDLPFLCARMRATDLVVREEAWRSVCKEYGFDYDQLLTAWGNFVYVNRNPLFFDWGKKLALTKTRYEVSANVFVEIEVAILDEEIEKHRETIAGFRKWLG